MSGVFDHPWLGGLFADADACTIWSAERQLFHMLAFEAAYSRALGEAGVVDPGLASAAAQLIEDFRPDISDLRDGTARDGLPVPALIAQILSVAGDLAPAIHKGTTSQDVIDTTLALSIRETTALLMVRIDALVSCLDRLVEDFGANPLMGRTRMQAAVPITVGDRVTAWRMPLDDHRERLFQIRPRVERVQLGGAAGKFGQGEHGGTTIAIAIARELGLHAPERSWHARRDGVAEFAGVLSLITGTLGKIGTDLCLMGQQGVDEVVLAGGGRSSAMAHKQNPILAELLVTLARFNAVQLSGMHHALIHEQERSGSAWALEWMILPQMAVATARSLSACMTICSQVSEMGSKKNS